MSRLQCFRVYATLICSKYPEKARELWAYQATMISDFGRSRGEGWWLYNTAFRQHISSLESTDFSKINQGLYSTTFLAHGGKGQFCQSCMLSDHTDEECALHPKRSVPVIQIAESTRGAVKEDPQFPRGKERKRLVRGDVCFAWNYGRCTTPFRRYSHVCA